MQLTVGVPRNLTGALDKDMTSWQGWGSNIQV